MDIQLAICAIVFGKCEVWGKLYILNSELLLTV